MEDLEKMEKTDQVNEDRSQEDLGTIGDFDQFVQTFSGFIQHRVNWRKILYSREKFREVGKIKVIDQNAKNAIFKIRIEYLTRQKIPETRKYTLVVYFQTEKHDQMDLDIAQLKEIKKLDIYPLGKQIIEHSSKKIGFPFLLLENIPEEDTMRNLRITLGLRNSRAVGKRVNRYLQKHILTPRFQKRGQKLVDLQEKFNQVIETHELALGLNNAVYTIKIQYWNTENEALTKDLILRVYPRNENLIKAQNEAHNMQEIQDLDIPKAKFYLFEEDTSHIGYRFLILEKLVGNPVLETIHTFTPNQTRQFLADLALILGKLHNIRTKKFQSYYMDLKLTRRMTYSTYIYTEVAQVLKSFREMKLDEEYHADTKYLYKWFKGHKPLLDLPGYSFTHGDMRPSNIIVNGYKISGLIDWEMSCYSDPAQDLGWTLFFFKLYRNLEKERGYFFEQYWKYCEKYDFEARVFFYEFIAAIKLFIYARANKRDNPEKYELNENFFSRVEKTFPQYLETVTYKINEEGQDFSEMLFGEDAQKEMEFKIKTLLMDTFAKDLDLFNQEIKEKIDLLARDIVDMINDYVN
ncbi:MAG: aminoglycoside phosphotransferase family protein [Promethearchaeota archaeon]|nr:MAG: aminoglycoside phosphotransferase family protein [Candidatus Lokiarchaeota archaeon]